MPSGTVLDKMKALMLEYHAIVMLWGFSTLDDDTNAALAKHFEIMLKTIQPDLEGVAGSLVGLNQLLPIPSFDWHGYPGAPGLPPKYVGLCDDCHLPRSSFHDSDTYDMKLYPDGFEPPSRRDDWVDSEYMW
jgi:hypothetical protein